MILTERRGAPARLDPTHLAKLLGSALADDTILASQAYTLRDTARLRILLRGIRAEAPALILPGFDRYGERNGHDVARLFPPLRYPDGREAKYLQPRGSRNRSYFPPLAGMRQAVDTPGHPLLITEGILKALAATQSGVPCIGLMGTECWSTRRADPDGPRELIDDLAGIDWDGRPALIAFDFDTVRKPGVNRAAAELARVLGDKGAGVRILALPPGPAGDDGWPAKQAVDDFIARNGAEAFRRWVAEQTADEPNRDLPEYREDVRRARLRSLGTPGRLYLDRSPTGAGKSHADGEAIKALGDDGRSLVVLPAHVGCEQVCGELNGRGIEASAFPPLNGETCYRHDEATEVIAKGFPIQPVLCRQCEHNGSCPFSVGYAQALASRNAVATHKRGEVMMGEMSNDRQYVSIHESPLQLLRPQVSADRGFAAVAKLAEWALMLLPFKRRQEVGSFYRRMSDIANELDALAEGGALETALLDLPAPAPTIPPDQHRLLWDTMNQKGVRIVGEAIRIVRDLASGEVDRLMVLVEARPTGQGNAVQVRRRVVAQWKTPLPRTATVIINDATASRSDIERAAGREVHDITPAGKLALRQPVVQVASDVTQGTSPDRAASILDGVLYDLGPQAKWVGVITHLKLIKALELREWGKEITWSHYRSGRSRGSNDWYREVDALVVLGTPRVPPEAIRQHLLALGDERAASLPTEEAKWGPDSWAGVAGSGERVTVRTRGYQHRGWHAAHVSLVHAELIQSIGRARPALPDGIPCVVVTREELNYPLAETGKFGPLTEVQARALAAMRTESGTPRLVTGPMIGAALGVNRQRGLEVLTELREAGRVRKVADGRFLVTPRPGLRRLPGPN